MKFKSILKAIGASWFLLLFVFLFIKTCTDDNEFEENAVVTTATVEGHEWKSVDRHSTLVAVGHYYVNGWKYPCFYEHGRLKPKGSIFRIKYNSKKPKHWRCVDE